MKKRTFLSCVSIILILCSMLLLFSCEQNEANEETTTAATTLAQEGSQTSGTAESTDPNVAQTEPPAHTEHQFGEWQTKREATCVQDGVSVGICEVCGETEYQSIPLIGHSYGADGSCACGANAENEEFVFELTEVDGAEPYYTIKRYNGSASKIIIPNTYQGIEIRVVRYLLPDVIEGILPTCDSVVFGSGSHVTEIGEQCFLTLQPTSIRLPASLKTLQDFAFESCRITSIVIPKNTVEIGKGVFSSCDALESVTVEEGNSVYYSKENCIIRKKDRYLIAGCKSSVIPNDGSVVAIGEYAFFSANTLESIDIPSAVTSIGRSAFAGCGAKRIRIPASVKIIGKGAFSSCKNVEEIYFNAPKVQRDMYSIFQHAGASGPGFTLTIGNAIKEIPDEFMSGIPDFKLTKLVFEEGSICEVIGSSAFSDCYDLWSVTLPQSLRQIGNSAFSYCTDLSSIHIPASTELIGSGAFYGCKSLKSATFEVDKGWYQTTKSSLSGGTAISEEQMAYPSYIAQLLRENKYYFYRVAE